MTMDNLFCVNSPHVVAEDVDGEVIVINLENGAYYSFRDSAAAIWQHLLCAEASLSEIVDELCDCYHGTREAVDRSVGAFLHFIEAEGLIVSAQKQGGHSVNPSERSTKASSSELPPFVVPVYEKYTDMQEFLLVDPIHEVDISEWPSARKRDPS